jgi:hypothetical protein
MRGDKVTYVSKKYMQKIIPLLLAGFLFCCNVPTVWAVHYESTRENEDTNTIQNPAGDSDFLIHLKASTFDPLNVEPLISPALTFSSENKYYLVQCQGPIQPQWIEDIKASKARFLGYIPEYTYLLYMEEEARKIVENLPFIRWIGTYHPAYKIQEGLIEKENEIELNVVVFKDDPLNLQKVRNRLKTLGGVITYDGEDNRIIRTLIDASKVVPIAFIPEVEWIDLYSPPTSTMNKIRTFTGVNVLLSNGFNGSGIIGEVKDDGIDQSHPDFNGQLIGTVGNPPNESHGTNVFGIVFSSGKGDSNAMGMLPGASGVFCEWDVPRSASVDDLVNNWGGVFQSNSWSSGDADSTYTTFSKENDQIIFDYDIVMLHSAGNDGVSSETCTQDSVAKNIIAVGGLDHYDNIARGDDQWVFGGIGGTPAQGPASDGRVKPDLSGPFDAIYTTESGGGYTNSFGGTSGATPVVAGAVGMVYQMYRDNHFGNNPQGYMPHASTVKAILIADAYQYEFFQADRFQQGWGGVDVGSVYARGENHFIVDEGDNVKTGLSKTYAVSPQGGGPLKISLVWTDVAQTPPASKHLVNDLNLKVTDPNNIVYWGNQGLNTSKWTSSGGDPDTINNVENVFIENPTSGVWTIEVIGENVPSEGDPYTPGVDQPFSLVASNAKETLIVDITNPSSGEYVNNITTVTGTGSIYVDQVEVKIDSGPWELALGNTSWSYDWDTNFVSDGTHTIYAKGINGTLFSKEKSVDVVVDNTPPSTSIVVGDPKYLNGSDLYVSSSTQFDINGADSGSGLDFIKYRIIYEGAEVVAWTIGNSFTLSSGEGNYSIEFYGEDLLGNNEDINNQSAYVDSSMPNTELKFGSPKYRDYPLDEWNVTTSTIFTISQIEEASSVDFFWYTVDGIFNKGDNFDLGGYLDGRHAITWGGQDVFGHNETGNVINVIYDTTSPITSLEIGVPKFRESINNPWNVTAQTPFSLTSNDDYVGINFTWYTIDGNYFEGEFFNLSGYSDGLHIITWGSSDNFGQNETGNEKYVILDIEEPHLSLNMGDERYRNSTLDLWNVSASTMFTIYVIEIYSGLNETWYIIDGEYFTGSSFTLNGYDEGIHMITVGARDNVGNNATGYTIIVNLDLSPPITSMDIEEPKFRFSQDDNWYVTSETTFILSSYDKDAGVKTTWFLIDGNYYEDIEFNLGELENGLHTISWGALDYLYNNDTAQSIIVNLDNKAPVTGLVLGEPNYRENIEDILNITFLTQIQLSSSDEHSSTNYTWYTINGNYFENSSFDLMGYPEGYHTISWGGVDILGNNETNNIMMVYLSTTPPTSILEIVGDKYRAHQDDPWIVTDKTLFSIKIEPTPPGVIFSWYMIDSNYFVGSDFSLSGIGEGVHRIRWGSQDNLDANETGNFQDVILDIIAPETILTIQGPQFQESLEEDLFVNRYTTFTLNPQDNQSGVSHSWYIIDDEFFLGSSFKLIGYINLQYTIKWGAVDNLGHNETGNEMNIIIDNEGPSVTIEVGEPNVPYDDYTLINSASAISFIGEDSGVGKVMIYYSTDGGVIYQVYDLPFTVSYKTRHIIYWAEDALGNKANESTINLVVEDRDSDLDGIDDLTDNDDDGDGLLDSEEDKNGNGIVDLGETDPKNPDTDFDGVQDDEDPYPLDKSRWGQEEEGGNIVVFIVFIVIAVLIILLFLFMIMRKPRELSQEVKFEPHDKGIVAFEPHKEEVEFESHEEEEVEFEQHDEPYEEEVEFESHEEEEVDFEPYDDESYEPYNDESYEEEFEFESHEADEVEFELHDEPYEEDVESETEEDGEVEFEADEEEELEFEEE